MKQIAIIGGGIIGLSAAYYLNNQGHKVTIFEQSDLNGGCSFGNAGMIVPSHIIPLAAPGMIAKGIRWMFNSSSPFYVKPRLNVDLLQWGWHFYRHATKQHVEKSIPALRDLSFLSQSLYREWEEDMPFDFDYEARGLLMLYKTPETEKEEIETAHIANRNGVEAQVLSPSEVQKLEPEVEVRVRGGVYFPGDAHLIPQKLVKGLIAYLKAQGVEILAGHEVLEFESRNRLIQSVTANSKTFECDELILAAGAWSGQVAKRLGLSLLMMAGKGYSFTMPDVQKNVRVPSILLEGRVAVTPMGNTLRFGGTMEMTGVDHRINMKRVRGIVNAIPDYYPGMNIPMPSTSSVWHGLRPCSPDGLPYIGRSAKISNLIFATGHAMTGMSLGPATGKIVSELVDGKTLSVPIGAFEPNRYN